MIRCPNCNEENSDNSKKCVYCGIEFVGNQNICAEHGNTINNTAMPSPSPATNQYNSSRLCCPNCGSNNIQVQIVSESKKVGCGTILLCIIFAWTIIGLILLISLLTNNTVNRKYYVCQNCGRSFLAKDNNTSNDTAALIIVILGSILLLVYFLSH